MNTSKWEWEFDADPHGVVPLGYYSLRNKYKVVGFCAPRGGTVRKLMVKIRYDVDPYQPVGDGEGATTLHYLSVLYDFFHSMDLKTFVNNVLYGPAPKS